MVLEGKVGLLSKGQQVELVHVHILDGVDEVRIKGSTATSWIPSELLNCQTKFESPIYGGKRKPGFCLQVKP
jgi:hypothetical protein